MPKDPNLEDTILAKVLASRKYRGIYPPTIKRIIAEMTPRYPSKLVEQKVRQRLHQVWGAYFKRPDYDKVLHHIEQDVKDGKSIDEITTTLLRLASTEERIPILQEFYRRIWDITGVPDTIVEYGCGLNALTYPWMLTDGRYTGIDVDTQLVEFINRAAAALGFGGKVHVQMGDIFDMKFPPANVALFLKMLRLLEHEQKSCFLRILEKTPARYLVVSYPTQTLTGRRKGMEENYRTAFLEMVTSKPWHIDELVYSTELVFIIKK